jgi:hypothetical protein
MKIHTALQSANARGQSIRRALLLASLTLMLTACADLVEYRSNLETPKPGFSCDAAENEVACRTLAMEPHKNYTLHFTEFDDQGWPFRSHPDQIDAAIDHIASILKDPAACARVVVFVHGWHHKARYDDENVQSFRSFLADISTRASQKAADDDDACEDPAVANALSATAQSGGKLKSKSRTGRNRAKIVGIYVGWRGDSFFPDTFLDFTSYWDRKSTADRVAQGSIRELFARLNNQALVSSVKAASPDAPPARRLRTYVIGHSFGASVVFRAVSQSLIDGFANGINATDGNASRFLDMVVLVNPAIEAARFDPLFRTAQKRRDYCIKGGNAERCDHPDYQAPLLSIFTAQNDTATHYAFAIGANLSNLFEKEPSPAQHDANRQTIGWDDAYKTHTLASNAAACRQSPKPVPWIPGPNGDLAYAAAGWNWCIADTLFLKHLGGGPVGGANIYNGPLWNVRVTESDIIDGHNGFWGSPFRKLLLTLFADEMTHLAE